MSEDVTIDFVSNSILHTKQFSWVFFVDCAMSALLTIFAIFYFNQFMGLFITHTLGWWLWHKHKIYFKVQSVKISLFSARIIFTNLVYVGTGQAVHIVSGNLTWKYWLPKRLRSKILNEPTECRPALELNLWGTECFIYNRESAYEMLNKPTKSEVTETLTETESSFSINTPQLTKIEQQIIEIFPLHVHFRQVGIVIGNDDTESLLLISAPHGDGLIDIASPTCSLDRYMITTNIEFENLKCQLRDNPSYQVSSITNAFKTNQKHSKRPHLPKIFRRNRKTPGAANDSDQPWTGLKRYTNNYDYDLNMQFNFNFDDESDLNAPTKANFSPNSDSRESLARAPDVSYVSEKTGKEVSENEIQGRLSGLPLEYAKVSQIAFAHHVVLEVMVDMPNPVEWTNSRNLKNLEPMSSSEQSYSNFSESSESTRLQPPIFEINLVANDPKITYGPWAERQRQSLMEVFYPRNCNSDDTKLPRLRTPLETLTKIKLQGDIGFTVPLREKSKDESYAKNFIKNYKEFGSEMQRNYGWTEFITSDEVNIEVVVPTMPTNGEYDTTLKLTSSTMQLRSSVNHETVLNTNKFNTDLHYIQPTVWNATHRTQINVDMGTADIFLLREHISLLSDLVDDFSDTKELNYALFTPTDHKASFKIDDFNLYMNVNKGNIINNPTSLEENTFVKFSSPNVSLDVHVPFMEITSQYSHSRRTLIAPALVADLSTPIWHTLNNFLDTKRLGRVKDFKLDIQESTVNPTSTGERKGIDSMIVDITGSMFGLFAHGSSIAYFERIAENYFGEYHKFKTAAEAVSDPHTEVPITGEFTRDTPDSDVVLRVRATNGCFLLPTHLFSSKECFNMQYTQLDIDTRFTNYYMDFQFNVSPVKGFFLQDLIPTVALDTALFLSDQEIQVEHLNFSSINAHAHRMFGLPPHEPTYAVQWDFMIEEITGIAGTEFWTKLGGAGEKAGFSFRDDENRPIFPPMLLYDITFVDLKIDNVDVKVPLSSESFLTLSIKQIDSHSSDLPSDFYSARRSHILPHLLLKLYNKEKVVLETSLEVKITQFLKSLDAMGLRAKQMQYVALNDALFHRAVCLMDDKTLNTPPFSRIPRKTDIEPMIPLPDLPDPLEFSQRDKQFFGFDSESESSLSDESLDNGRSYFSRFSTYSSDIPSQRQLVLPENEETASTVIDLKPFIVQVDYELLEILPLLISTDSIDLEEVIDQLQMKVVDTIVEKWSQTSLRTHLHIPQMSVQFRDSLTSDYAKLDLTEVSFMAHTKRELSSFHFQLQSLSTWFLKGMEISPAATIKLEDFVFWWQNSTERDAVGSLKLKSFDTLVYSEQLEWLVSFIAKMQHSFKNLSDGMDARKQIRPDATQVVFYYLSKAGEDYSINEDSYVLSRPSGSIHSPEHVRTDLSWRIVLRLRFLLQKLPPSELQEIRDLCSPLGPTLPAIAEHETQNLFKKWRSWEHSDTDVQNADIFKFVFANYNLFEKLAVTRVYFSAAMHILSFRIQHPHEDKRTNIVLEGLKSGTDATQSLGVTLRCNRMRVKGYDQLIPLVADFISYYEHYFESDDFEEHSGDEDTTKSVYDESLASVRPSLYSKLQNASFSVFLLDSAVVCDLGLVYVETQNHQVQYTALFNSDSVSQKLVHTGTLVTSNGGFRIFNTKDNTDVLDSLVNGVHLGYTSHETDDTTDTWASLKVNSASLVSHLPAVELSKLVVEFLEQFLVLVDTTIAKHKHPATVAAEKRRSYHESVKRNLEGKLRSSKFVNVDISNLKMRISLVEDLQFLLHGSDLGLKLRHTGPLISLIDLRKAKLGICSASKKTNLASFELKGGKYLIKYDPQQSLIDLNSSTQSLKFETMSIIWILEYTTRKHIDTEAMKIMQNLNKAYALIHDTGDKYSDPNKPQKVEDVISNFRVYNNTKSIAVHLPLDISSFELQIDNCELKLEGQNNKSNLKMGSLEISNLALLLKTPQHDPSREILATAFVINAEQTKDLDRLNFVSSYTRLSFDPEALGSIIIAMDKLGSQSQLIINRNSQPQPAQHLLAKPEEPYRFGLNELERIRLNMSFKSFQIVWFFGPTSSDGLIFCYDELQIVMLKLMGKMIWKNAKLCPKTDQIAPPDLNYANWPLLEASMCISNQLNDVPSVDLSLSGTSLVLRMTHSLSKWICVLLDSFTATKATFAVIRSSFQAVDKPAKEFHLPFSIGLVSKFESGVYELFEESGRNVVKLVSPAVNIAAEFGKNRLAVRVDLSPTKNEILPMAVSEIRALVKGFTQEAASSVKSINSTETTTAHTPNSTIYGTPANSINGEGDASVDRNSLLQSKMNLDVQIHFGSQELYLSCHPFAKVGAQLSTKGLDVVITTPGAICMVAVAKGLRLSLQHVHSREVSAMTEVNQLNLFATYAGNSPLRLSSSVVAPALTIDLTKIHEIRMFYDVWFESDEPLTTIERTLSGRRDPSFYESAFPTEFSSIAYLANFEVKDLSVSLGLGPTIGNASVSIDQVWAVVNANSGHLRVINCSLSTMAAIFEGRLGGVINIQNVEMTFVTDQALEKLYHQTINIGHIGTYFSLDFHAFFTGMADDLSMLLTTQDQQSIGSDKLHMFIRSQSINLALTALTASHAYDIMLLFSRLKNQVSIAASFVLPSAADKVATESTSLHEKATKPPQPKNVNVRKFEKLLLGLKINELSVQIFPTDFTDVMALKMYVSRFEIHYDLTHQSLATDLSALDLGIEECVVGVINLKSNDIMKLSTESKEALDYVLFLNKIQRPSSMVTILDLPELTLMMDTTNNVPMKEVLYTFSNQFHGSIEVGWNLGCVNFIKQMLKEHEYAWESRHTVNAAATSIHRSRSTSTVSAEEKDAQLLRDLDSHSTRDGNAENDDPTWIMGRKYIAKEPPVIMIPQLRDLGDATPPIEWLGVNRERLPLFVHVGAAQTLEKLAEVVERVYK